MSVVINYCSSEYCFLDATIAQCMKFTDDIVVSYGSHYYNGTPETMSHYDILKTMYPQVQFVMYDVDVSLPSSEMKGVHSRRNAYWHNLARWKGFQALKRKDWVFFLDVDEIPEGDRVKEFLTYAFLREESSYKLANYWYFKAPIHQATAHEDSIVLVHGSRITENGFFGDGERDHLASSTPECRRLVKGMDGTPLFHHYSWVRSKESLMKKLTSWGHATDYPDPERLVAIVFSNSGINDIVHHYTYRTVANYFGLDPNKEIPS